MGYFIKKIKKINHHIRTYVSESKNVFLYIYIYVDLFFTILVYGVNLDEYFQYEFFGKKMLERRKYIVYRKRMRIVNTCNDKSKIDIFDSKIKFNNVFSEYIGRDWLDMDDCSKEQFEMFVQKHKKAFVKPKESFYGLGISVRTFSEDIDKEYEELKQAGALVEELIIENEELREFNPESVNTLRVVTLIGKDGVPVVKTTNLRMGVKGKHADNFHHNGLAALVDVEKGIVVSTASNRFLEEFSVHPDSGKQIVGYKIPYWDEVVKCVKKAALVVPQVRYVGWDVVVGVDGKIIIVEGNQCADPDVSQIPDKTGKWYLYKDELN